jgi:restriction endonuclease S subunit
VVYECGQGTAQKAINMVMLNDLDVPIPSLERQQQIVEAIDGWAQLAEHEEQALKMLEKQMVFQVKEMGKGQPRVKLETIAKDIIFGFMISSGDYGTEGVPVIKTKNIKSKRVMYPADDQKIKTKLDDRYKIKKGDMMIVLGGSPGENGIWEFDEEAWLNQDCAKISIDNPATKMFVFYSLQGQAFDDYIASNTTKTTIGHISRGVVREIEIPLPPLTEQQKLQLDFDEIQHKHAKIAIYKAKAQEAIQRLIPGA